MYANSDTPTRTQTEEAFGKMFAEMLGDLQVDDRATSAWRWSSRCSASRATPMAMALRERTTEVAVLKAIGFGKPLVLVLVLAEAILVAGVGGAHRRDRHQAVLRRGGPLEVHIESDINYVAGGLTLNAAAAYTDAKTKGNICDFSLGNADCNGLDDQGDPDFLVTPSGTRLPVTPKFKASATARYAWPMGPGRAHVQAGIAYQGSASADIRQNIGTIDDQSVPINPNDALGRIKSSTLVDLFAGYEWGRYSFEVFGENIFDERNELSRFTSCNSSYCYRLHIVPGRPRTIGIRAGAKF